MPRVGLFIPCYIDQCYPQVGMATLELLERFGCQVGYPDGQTCCGQPMANTGMTGEVLPLAKRFLELFETFDYVVGPSGSCVAMIRNHYEEYFPHDPRYEQFRKKVYELCEFLVDVIQVKSPPGNFPHQVGLHQSCHGLRELRMAGSSEVVGPAFSKMKQLLEGFSGLRLTELSRPDECCGFGGTFSISEEAVSCMMGKDRIQDHREHGTEVLTSADMSCLMHLDGLIRRDRISQTSKGTESANSETNRTPIRVMHIAELLLEGMGKTE